MPKKPKRIVSPDVVDQWPEIFDDIEIKSIPVEYLRSIYVHFQDGKVWDIDIDQTKVKAGGKTSLEDSIEALFEEYEDSIVHVDFRLDTEKVKRDIQKRTAYFMKKRK